MPDFASILNLSSVCLFVCLSVWCVLPKVLLGNTPQYLSQIQSSSWNFQHMSGLVSWVDYYCLWACTCTHAYTAHVNVHATWGSIQTIIFQLNEFRFLWNLAWLSRRYQGCIPKKCEFYVHACKCYVHEYACRFLYLVKAFKQCRICWWWRKLKLLRRVQCILKIVFILLEQYVHACEHNVHKSACMFLYLSIAFK